MSVITHNHAKRNGRVYKIMSCQPKLNRTWRIHREINLTKWKNIIIKCKLQFKTILDGETFYKRLNDNK